MDTEEYDNIPRSPPQEYGSGGFFVGSGSSSPNHYAKPSEPSLVFTIPIVFCWGFNVQGQCAIADIEDGSPINASASPAPAPNAGLGVPALYGDLGYLHPPAHGLAAQNPPGAGNPNQAPNNANPVAERAHNLTTPQMVKFFLDKPPIRLITTGGNHALALLEDGSLYAWGANTDGQLGLGHTDSVVQPTELTFFKEKEEQVQALYSGYNYSLVLTESGTLYSFGYNNFGQLGLQFLSIRADTPQMVSYFSKGNIKIKELATGGNHCLLLTYEGQVFAWGYNKYGQLGLSNNTNYDTPQIISYFDATRPVAAVSAGQRHSVILARSSEVYTFGHNFYGALGLGHNNDCASPQMVKFFAGMKISQVIAGGYHTLFVSEEGRIFSTGYNTTGELGLGTQENTNIPKNISFFNNKKIVSIAVGSQHTLVLLDTQEVYSWGYNKFGQLGLGHTHSQHSPKLLEFFRDKPISRIYGGYRHTLLVTGAYRPRLNGLQQSLLRLLDTHMFSDVTLVVGGASFLLHKPILYARASQLLQVALQWQAPSNAVEMGEGGDEDVTELAKFLQGKRISTRAFRLLLEYIYAEQLPPYTTDLETFVHLSVCASLLKLTQLERVVYFHLTGLINSQNVLLVLHIAVELESEVLKNYALRFIAYNKAKFPTNKLKALMKDKFDADIIWQIMALMDEGPRPPMFPLLVEPTQSTTSAVPHPDTNKSMPFSGTIGEFKSNLAADLGRLFDDPSKAATLGVSLDLQLQVGEEMVRAHRCVLAARNAWFAAALNAGMKESQTGVIRIVGSSDTHTMTISALHAFVRYLYTNSYSHINSSDDALLILANANYFLLSHTDETDPEGHAPLIAHCEEIILRPMTFQNAPQLLVQVDRLGLAASHLRDRVMSWTIDHYQEVATASSQLLEIPDRLFREIQIHFNLHLLRLTAGSNSSSLASSAALHAANSDAGPAR